MHPALPAHLLFVMALVRNPTVVAAPAATPEPIAAVTSDTLLPGERQFNACLRLPVDKPVRVMLKPESEINDVIAWISSVTCRGFIVPTGLQLAGRKVTLIAPTAISAAEAYRLFLALLDSAQLTVEPVGRFLRIIEAGKSGRSLLPIYRDGQPAQPGDGYATRLLHLQHAAPEALALILQGYRSESGSITAYPPSSTLILTDRTASLERLVELVAALDVPGEEMQLWTLPARHVSAADLAQTLSDLADIPVMTATRGTTRKVAAAPTPGAAPARGGGMRLLPDDRAGRLLVVASEAAFARLATLAAKLDVPAETRAAKVHAYRCRHADCDAVASILGTLAGINVARGPAPEGARTRAGAAVPPSVAAAAGAAGERPAPPLFAGDVRVTSDPTTNALLVLSSLDDFRTLRRLIEEVDVVRKQVFIEATIIEVVRRKDRKVGVAFHGGSTTNNGAVVGGFNAGQTLLLDEQTIGSALVGLSGLAVGAPLEGVASALGLPTGSVPSLGAFIQLLQQDENVDLIANPHLLITNNYEGEISVGQTVPVQGAFTGSVNGAAINGLVPAISINREKVALTLKLTPHVNEDGLIRLEIDQQMSELGTTGQLGPTTTERSTHTTVFARDQQTIVIGGLTRERQADSSQKIPLLGDIPLIGVLFRSTSKAVEKQNIIIALTPYVIDNPSDLTRVLEAKLRDRRDYVRLFGSDQERRLLEGPLPARSSPGMLERINRAVKELDEDSGEGDGEGGGKGQPGPALPTTAAQQPAQGVPLPGS